MTVGDTRGILPSVSNCRQLWQVAKRCSWQRPVARSSLLVQPSRHVQLQQSLNLENSFLLSAVLTSDLAFSLSLSLSLRTFLQQEGLLTTLAYPCAFSQSVFTHGLSSSHQISHFWSSLGHNGHCCVFWVVLGPGESAGGHFLRSPSPFVHNHMLEQRERRRSHRDCGPSVVVRDRTSSRRAQCRAQRQASYVDVRPCARCSPPSPHLLQQLPSWICSFANASFSLSLFFGNFRFDLVAINRPP